MPTAAERWTRSCESLAIPRAIVEAAPESPWGFSVAMFAHAADQAVAAETSSSRIARDAVPAGGSVLDVGCGAGAGSLPLAPPAARLTGVDESRAMLDAFAERASSVAHEEIEGRWPDVEAAAPAADVVVCHHVLYNVADLAPFVSALTAHARRRVVVEITDEHPRAWLTPYWKALHGLDHPAGPRAADALAVVRETGARAQIERWTRPMRRPDLTGDDLVASVRRMVCLSPERDGEVAKAIERFGVPAERTIATIWWDAG